MRPGVDVRTIVIKQFQHGDIMKRLKGSRFYEIFHFGGSHSLNTFSFLCTFRRGAYPCSAAIKKCFRVKFIISTN